MKRHHESPVLLYFCRFPGWLAWFSLQIFCLNNKIHFSLANATNSASLEGKMVWKWRFLLIHKQQTNLWMPTIPPRLAGKIVKYRPLSEPIRLQDLEDSARSKARRKINKRVNCLCFLVTKHYFEKSRFCDARKVFYFTNFNFHETVN